jgi:hypothetical protein
MLEVFLRAYQSDWSATAARTAPIPEKALPFPRWRMQDVLDVVARDVPPEHRWAWGMYKGDHWQGGWGWAGPMVGPEHPEYQRLWGEIMKMFSSRNVIREVVETHVDGVLGRPMRWSLVPIRATPDERDATPEALKALIAEASALVRQWLDQRNVHDLLRAFLTDLLMPPGRAVLRLFLPRGAAEPVAEGSRILQLVSGDDFGATLAAVFAEKPDVERARLYTEPDTQRDIGVAIFRALNAGRTGYQDAASVAFLNPAGALTMVGAIYQDGSTTAVGYDLGGRLPVFQRSRLPLVTQQLLQQNRILNYAESTIPRNLTTAGFLDRVIKSAQLNGRWVKDASGVETWEMDENNLPRFGPGEVTVLQPLVIEDDNGGTHVTTPEMDRGEPVLPTGAIQSSDHIYQNMLREAGQANLIAGEMSDATVIRYGLSLLHSAVPMTAALRWVIETALAWAEALRGEEGRYTSQLRAQTSAYVNVGPVTPEQRAALTAAFEKSLLSRETAQELMGVDDVDSENDRIAAQPGSAIDLAIRMANSYKMLTDAGMPPRLAAIHSGYSDADAAEIEREQGKREQQQMQQQQAALRLQASLAPSPAPGGLPGGASGSAGLRAARRGRPSGTAERNPGQQQDKGARALQDKPRNRRQP